MTSGPIWDHVLALTDEHGTYEHADHAVPRREHGYCVDDVARVLVMAARQPDRSPAVVELTRSSMAFLAAAQAPDGSIRNRRAADGSWGGRPEVADCWGRSLWAFGVAATHAPDDIAADARACFGRGCLRRSPWPRAMAYAALGATAIVDADPTDPDAHALLVDAAAMLGGLQGSADWRWPEPRLTYANAVIPEAMLAVGAALSLPVLVAHGFDLLSWLLARETRDGHLSLTPAGGAGPHDVGPSFDQQPIEVAALADACGRALVLTGEPRWASAIAMAAAWFDGDNDAGVRMWDPVTGGGYDGLEPTSANQNQGAESTLALISVRQQASRLAPVPL